MQHQQQKKYCNSLLQEGAKEIGLTSSQAQQCHVNKKQERDCKSKAMQEAPFFFYAQENENQKQNKKWKGTNAIAKKINKKYNTNLNG